MSKTQVYKYLSITVFAAALMLVGMLSVSIFNGGVTAQDFEMVSDIESYTRDILAADALMEKLLKFSLWFGYLPIGILVYTFPHPTLDLLRYIFMLSGMTILGLNYFVRYRHLSMCCQEALKSTIVDFHLEGIRLRSMTKAI